MKIATSLAALLIMSLAGPVMAKETLVLMADQTQLLDLPGTPATVVIGNPSFADVTIQGKEVFLHGKAFGTTNIIIMDAAGTRMADFEVTVMKNGSFDVAMWKPLGRYSYVCAPDCETTFHVGDNTSAFDNWTSEAKVKLNLATGKTSSEAAPPPPAQ